VEIVHDDADPDGSGRIVRDRGGDVSDTAPSIASSSAELGTNTGGTARGGLIKAAQKRPGPRPPQSPTARGQPHGRAPPKLDNRTLLPLPAIPPPRSALLAPCPSRPSQHRPGHQSRGPRRRPEFANANSGSARQPRAAVLQPHVPAVPPPTARKHVDSLHVVIHKQQRDAIQNARGLPPRRAFEKSSALGYRGCPLVTGARHQHQPPPVQLVTLRG